MLQHIFSLILGLSICGVSPFSRTHNHCRGSMKNMGKILLTSFPGNLHLILVLNPSSLLSSAPSPSSSTDLGFRFSQDDFLLKMPVVMLRSVGDLLRYIDENHLTTDFTAKVQFCQSDWVVLRTSIETFAVTVKEIAQLLQRFGSELSDTELPDEANAIEFLLHSHTHRYRQMKDDIRSVLKEGRLLLSNLETVKASKRDAEEEREIQADMDTFACCSGSFLSELFVIKTSNLCLCLNQEEMARAQVLILHGHQLAANHHYALALIIQRCNELRHHCDVITIAIRTKRASLTRTRDLLVFCEQALRWCDEGAYLLASQMVDKFQTREGAQEALQYLSCHQERAPSAMKNNQDTLSFEFQAILTPQLQSQVSMVTEKLNSMQCMIRNREQCLRKLADVQVRPIQLVAPRPEPDQTFQRCKSPLFSPKHGRPCSIEPFSFFLCECQSLHSSFILFLCLFMFTFTLFSHIMKELIATERIYVDELLSVLLGYRAEMEDPSMANLLPVALRSQKDVLFGNMPEIYQFHSRIFLQDLQSCLETPESVGACFLKRKEKFQVYERYCQNKPRSVLLWRQCADSPFFQECQKKLDHKLGLDSYLLKPVQRLTKYQLLLKELLKHCTEERYRCELQEALDSMLELLKSVNDSMHQIAITGYQGDLSQLGRVVMQGSFSVWISHKRAAVRMKELARFKPMQRHLFLYEHALLFCKRRDEDNHDRTPFYSFKSCLRMSAVGITENVKGDVKKFEIWYSSREVVYIVQVCDALFSILSVTAKTFQCLVVCYIHSVFLLGSHGGGQSCLAHGDSKNSQQPAKATRFQLMLMLLCDLFFFPF
uniref:MCF.2 cell line derived transforming sequence n=1 Tax=Oreochromis niloticus TaxID=8128 RepID=A0A669EUP3_ORENI